MALHIVNLGTRQNKMPSLTSLSPYSRGKSSGFPLSIGWGGGPRTGMDVVEMREISAPAKNLTNICQNE